MKHIIRDLVFGIFVFVNSVTVCFRIWLCSSFYSVSVCLWIWYLCVCIWYLCIFVFGTVCLCIWCFVSLYLVSECLCFWYCVCTWVSVLEEEEEGGCQEQITQDIRISTTLPSPCIRLTTPYYYFLLLLTTSYLLI